jgi:hypothetical protein
MKISDLKKAIKIKERSELEQLVIKLYKLIPKSKIEDSQIDIEIEPHINVQTEQADKQAEDEEWLLGEISEFISLFYEQKYGIPNRVIAKSRRSKWRFEVMGFYKEIGKIWKDSERKQALADIFMELYIAMAYGCSYYLVSSDDLFASIRKSQVDFFEQVVIYLKEVYSGEELQKKLITLTTSPGLSSDTIPSDLYGAIPKIFDNPLFIEEFYDKLLAHYDQKKSEYVEKKKKDKYTGDYHLVNIFEGLIIQLIALSEFDKVEKLFLKEYSTYGHKDMMYYVVTRILQEYAANPQKTLLSILSTAEKNGIDLRDRLKELMQKLKADINAGIKNIYI